MSMTHTCTPGSPAAPDRPTAMTGAWQPLTVGQRDGWVAVARAKTEGEPDLYWCGDASAVSFVDDLECPALGTGTTMPALVAVYPTPTAVVIAWQCHVDNLRRVGSTPPSYDVEPWPLEAIENRGAVPDRTP